MVSKAFQKAKEEVERTFDSLGEDEQFFLFSTLETYVICFDRSHKLDIERDINADLDGRERICFIKKRVRGAAVLCGPEVPFFWFFDVDFLPQKMYDRVPIRTTRKWNRQINALVKALVAISPRETSILLHGASMAAMDGYEEQSPEDAKLQIRMGKRIIAGKRYKTLLTIFMCKTMRNGGVWSLKMLKEAYCNKYNTPTPPTLQWLAEQWLAEQRERAQKPQSNPSKEKK